MLEPFPAYPSGKSRDEASGKMGSGKKFYHNAISEADFAFCREKWPVHGGQLQLHRYMGTSKDSSSTVSTASVAEPTVMSFTVPLT